MKCAEARKWVRLYLDSELDTRTSAEVRTARKILFTAPPFWGGGPARPPALLGRASYGVPLPR